jgi:CheY-like chemotaxis protein
MALRVLLADESSTIKKVFQLALQDFAVEVRPVNLGVDVLPVAKSFQPDIIFADVLLQKKNGYEVCSELKADSQAQKTPVVLMWSGFMELDEDKFQASLADARLEKPFDVAALRKLVSDLVPKTRSHRISQFLKFPKMPEMEEPQQAANSTPQPEAQPEGPGENDEEFKQVSIPQMKGAERFRLNIDASEEDADMSAVDLSSSREPVDVQSLMGDDEAAEAELDEPEIFQMRENKRETARESVTEPPRLPLSKEEVLELARTEIKAQVREIVESVAWKVIPDLAQQIIERELQRLLKEKDASY